MALLGLLGEWTEKAKAAVPREQVELPRGRESVLGLLVPWGFPQVQARLWQPRQASMTKPQLQEEFEEMSWSAWVQIPAS